MAGTGASNWSKAALSALLAIAGMSLATVSASGEPDTSNLTCQSPAVGTTVTCTATEVAPDAIKGVAVSHPGTHGGLQKFPVGCQAGVTSFTFSFEITAAETGPAGAHVVEIGDCQEPIDIDRFRVGRRADGRVGVQRLGPTSSTSTSSSTTSSSTSSTSTSSTTTPPASTTLGLQKTGPTGAFPNQEFDFTITVSNTGSATATGVRVVDTLPSQGSFVSSTPPGTPSAPAPGDTYTVELGDIPASSSAAVTLRWRAPDGAGDLTNTATASAGNAPAVGPASAIVPVGISSACDPCGVVAAGTGLRNRDQGTISIAGIPAGATVGRAVLVWGILYDGPTPPNTITFAGQQVAADVTATVSGDLCWGDSATIGYAADVTGLVSGNGDYVVSDPPRGITRIDDDPDGTLPYTDGATLVVFYTGGGSNNQVLSDFAYDTNTDTDSTIHREFSGITSVGAPASLILAGPDGQSNAGETFTLTAAGTVTLQDTWDGSDPQQGASFPIGNLWDTDRYDVTSILPTGQTSLTVDHSFSNDCIGVGAAILEVSQG